MEELLASLKWLKHASFCWEGPPRVYFDPWQVEGERADIIFVTHPHYDHFDAATVRKLAGEETVVVGPAGVKEELPELTVITMSPGQQQEIRRLEVRAIPAYNQQKHFHPRAENWLGFIVRFPEAAVYHAGDTDLIPEMKEVDCDIALLPCGGTYTMNVEEAAQAARMLRRVRRVVPMHYGYIVGAPEDGKRLVALLGEKTGVLLEPRCPFGTQAG
jgi:L-ascorbate metabolism protein UlaG (beta-lactamase superfamily)